MIAGVTIASTEPPPSWNSNYVIHSAVIRPSELVETVIPALEGVSFLFHNNLVEKKCTHATASTPTRQCEGRPKLKMTVGLTHVPEFLSRPQGALSFLKIVRWGCQIYHAYTSFTLRRRVLVQGSLNVIESKSKKGVYLVKRSGLMRFESGFFSSFQKSSAWPLRILQTNSVQAGDFEMLTKYRLLKSPTIDLMWHVWKFWWLTSFSQRANRSTNTELPFYTCVLSHM